MPRFRRDQIPFMASCFINFIWSFASFLSVDMIKLYSYQFMHDVNYPSLFYGIFGISFIFLIFLKFNKVFTTVMIIWFNFFVHLVLLFFIYFPIKNRIFFLVVFGIWSHLFALNLISTVYLASYNLGGLHGLIIGTTLSYYIGYFLQHAVEHPSDFNIASRKSTCNWFIAIRFIASVLSFKFYRDYLEFFFYFEFKDSVKRISMTDMFKWVDGRPVEIMSSVRISELMPSSIDYSCIKHIFTDRKDGFVYLIIVYFAFLTTSFFSPVLTPTPLILSIFVRNEVYFVEFLGGLIGVITAILLRRYIRRMLITMYFIHYFFVIGMFLGFNTYAFNMYKHKNILYAFSFFSSSIGTFVLIYSFINYISFNSLVHCTNLEKKGKFGEDCYTCCKNDTATCLCYNRNLNETCSTINYEEQIKDSSLKCINIWTPWNNHSMYRDWTYSDCEFCLSQNYKNREATCTCHGSSTGEKGIEHCCTCSCATCGIKQKCECNCNSEGKCDKCCCNKTFAANYLLKNCVVSCCPYCDMCLLLECKKIPCVCLCSHKDHIPRNSIDLENDVDKKEAITLTKVKLRLQLSPSRHIYLCTYTTSPDFEKLQKLFCCCDEKECKGPDCCIKCCKRCKSKDNPCGKHFDFADCKVSSCCHYDLKIWVSLKELNSTFHIGQKPFKNKYNQINSLVFTNEKCRNCCIKTNCCKRGDCKLCQPVDVVKLIEESDLSQSGGAIKLKCGDDQKKREGKCACCCCCGDNSECKCSCSSHNCKDCECKDKKCRAIKVLPTNLPYQFRLVDIKRNEVIAAVGFAVLIFCFIKLLVALILSIINQTDSLKLNLVVGDFTSVDKVTIKSYPMMDYVSDKIYALERISDYKGPDNYLINYAIDIEMKELEDRARSIKELMDELNSLKFDRWLEEITKSPQDIMPVGYTKLRFYRHINAYIDFALTRHAFKTADRIFVYFDKFPHRWEIEWSDFERRFLQNLKVYTNYSLSLNSVGYFDTNAEFQKLINNRQSLILSHLNSNNDQLTTYLSRNRELYENFKTAKPYRKLPRYIDLWEYRANLIKTWASDNTLFLNWTPFIVSMERISLWNKLYRRLYMRAFRERYDDQGFG